MSIDRPPAVALAQQVLEQTGTEACQLLLRWLLGQLDSAPRGGEPERLVVDLGALEL